MHLQLEQQCCRDDQPIPNVLITPRIDKDYWTFRVQVSSRQAIVAFPKFSTMGIGFQRETDWNTNLPYTVCAECVYVHIKHNQGDPTIPKSRVLEAIRIVQDAIRTMRREAVQPCQRSDRHECTAQKRFF